MKAWRQISPTGRTLLAGVFLTGLTTYMFLPLLALQLTRQGLSATRAGLVVGVLAFTTQGFALIVGPVVDRLGVPLTMALGLGLRIAGYGLLIVQPPRQIALPLLAVTSIGLGGSLLGIAIKTQLVDESGVPMRTMLALRSTFINVGVIAGPALGVLAAGVGFWLVLVCCIASHIVLGARLFIRQPTKSPRQLEPAVLVRSADVAAQSAETEPDQTSTNAPTASSVEMDSSVDQPASGVTSLGRPLVLAVLSSVMYYVLFAQINLSLPLAAEQLTGHIYSISVLFTLNAVLSVLFQYPLLGLVFKDQSPNMLLVIGFGAFGAAFAALVFAGGWALLVVFVLLATLAEMLIGPSIDEQAVRDVPVRRRAFALGLVAAAGAVGSLFGSGLGGYLFETGGAAGAGWIVFVVIALIGVGLNVNLTRRTACSP